MVLLAFAVMAVIVPLAFFRLNIAGIVVLCMMAAIASGAIYVGAFDVSQPSTSQANVLPIVQAPARLPAVHAP